ncbi:hypothetical protein D779_2680 [Imhoffiella purpurea]|uniref:Calcineurin-like phosphoesterase domain-containing protein n=2 Tax=Imhoffiella purpurea TaxID=1249627 RepID=W9V5C7_9GAMM|nr:hypothetical protein D779_2680 [Imhoffiella purpurea]
MVLAAALAAGSGLVWSSIPAWTDLGTVRSRGLSQSDGRRATGIVFEDLDGDGFRGAGEPGIGGVMVSNGREVVLTDASGRYLIPESAYRGDMDIFVSTPDCYRAPLGADGIPRFAYVHKSAGSSKSLRFGGLAPTGDLPDSIDFPLIGTRCMQTFSVLVSGDTQAYSNLEVGYVRDTLAKELAERDDVELLLIEGDIVGDDLGLMPRLLDTLSLAGVPLYLVQGNHDLDLDADSDADASDTFRRLWGPRYYSFTIGKVHFVVLDNVEYPCSPTDPSGRPDARWDHCAEGKDYDGRLSEIQLEWLERDLEHVPEDHLIVLNTHIPIVSFLDQASIKHSEDRVERLYEILGYRWIGDAWTQGRPALALSGHTHTIDRFEPGDYYAGWADASHPFPIPFPQIVVGATAGSWWSGDFDSDRIPESLQRMGAPRGYFIFRFEGNGFTETFKATGKPIDRQMSLSLDSPAFRDWFERIRDWSLEDEVNRDPVPPGSDNTLGDSHLLTPADLASTDLVVNLWNGSRGSRVWAWIDDRDPVRALRTQAGDGEGMLESPDPHALRRQLSVLRYALQSGDQIRNRIWNGDLGNRANGFELLGGVRRQAESQRPLARWQWALHSSHLWTLPLPENLEEGSHRILIQASDVHGRVFEESMLVEVRTPQDSTDPFVNDPTDEPYARRFQPVP